MALPQYKINQLAKDLGIKTKEITGILKEKGIEVRVQKVLEPFEFDILFEALTRAYQIKNIEDYIDGITYIPSKIVKEHESRKSQKRTEAKSVQTAEKQKQAGQPKEQQKVAEQKPAEPKLPGKKPAEQPKTAESQKGAERKTAPQPKKPQEGRPAAQAQQQTQAQKKEKERKEASKEKFRPQPIVRKQAASPERQAKKRIIDTRGMTIDLSKYDDRFETIAPESVRDMRGGSEKVKRSKAASQPVKGQKIVPKKAEPIKKQPVHVSIPDEIRVGELASRLKVTASEVIKRLMIMGVMVTVNEYIDYDTAYLVSVDLGAEVTREVVVTIEDKLFEEEQDGEEDLQPRAPVVCVMGHVDHGKTSLLDAMRHSNVTAAEAGGITQHIGAYRVKVNGREITFLDTPGHEAFTEMRARGAMATDIAILVVAADDGIMPQTVEAINHAKAAGVDIIVAINKIDKPTANPDRVIKELTKYDLVPEAWGGDVICVPVSALTGQGINDLLESILLMADIKEFKANPNRRAKGIVIEAKLDKGRGPVATLLVQNGTLHTGDVVIAGTAVGRVRLMTDHKGKVIKAATSSMPVEITGLSEVPSAGDTFNAVEDEKMARTLAEKRRAEAKEEAFKANARANLNDLFAQISEGVKTLNIIVKADVDGSAEAVKAALEKISNEEVKVKVIHSAVGGITEGDVTFAAASNAIIIGFNVRPDKPALDSAARQGVEIRTYRVIYDCIEEVTAAMKGMLAPKYRENLLGHAEVRQAIRVPNVGIIAGSYVQDGKVTRNSLIRVLRGGVVIFEDKIASLKRFKDDVREVAAGYECGIGLEKFSDIKVGDILEAYIMEEIQE
ncbi:MAG: translation initiation factor IF-2 [Eubacteriales bacterium]|jgi:translation initiation factor IF-2